MELGDKPGHFKYLEDLKSPFLMFSEASDNFDHFGGGMKMVVFKILKMLGFYWFSGVSSSYPRQSGQNCRMLQKTSEMDFPDPLDIWNVQVCLPTPSELREKYIQSPSEIRKFSRFWRLYNLVLMCMVKKISDLFDVCLETELWWLLMIVITRF